MPRSSVPRATKAGGTVANKGKTSFLAVGDIVENRGISVMMVSKLFLSVMAMIGKFVDKVKTGKSARK